MKEALGRASDLYLSAAATLIDAEKKAQTLLDEMNVIDARLSSLTPADPTRAELKAKKAEILPRYRGAKEHVKALRRIASMEHNHKRELVGLEHPPRNGAARST